MSRPLVLATVIAALLPLPVLASLCGPEDTFDLCDQKVLAALASEPKVESLADAGVEAARRALARANPGADPNVLSGIGNKVDFSSLVKFLIDSGAIEGSQNEDTGAFSLDLTNFLGFDAASGYKVQLVTRKPEVFKSITDAIEAQVPEADRAERLDAVKSQLNNLDDATLSLSFAPSVKGRGRNPAAYREGYGRLLLGALDRVSDETLAVGAAERLIGKVVQEHHLADDVADELSDSKLSFVDALQDASEAQKLADATEASVRARQARLQGLRAVLSAGRYFEFAKLIDNQPQFVLSGEQTFRDPVIGPDETKIRVSYEYGFANVNRLNRFCRNNGLLMVDRKYFDCLASYLEGGEFKTSKDGKVETVPSKVERLNAGHRLSFSAEYSEVDAYDFDPGEGLDPIVKKGDHTVMMSLGYSRYLNIVKTADTSTRLDVSWSYEDSGSDKSRNDRHIGQAVLTIPATNGMFLAAGLKYASDPKFRGDVDKELSARVGLTFKFLPPEGEEEEGDDG